MKNLLLLSVCFITFFGNSQTDNCTGATNLPVNASCVNSTFTNNENGRPETGAPSPSCVGANPGSDVWYTITGTGGNVQITLSGSNRNGTLAAWSNCPATTEIACIAVTAGASGSIIFPTTAGVTYYIQIQRQSGKNNDNMDGSICAQSVSSTAPANDNPCAATPIPVGTSCTLTNTTNLNATATSGVTAPGCANYSGGDVWYTVVMPASGSLDIETYANSLTDGGMAVYSGTCSSLTLLSCDDDSGPGLMPAVTITGTSGTTYYIRFWEYGNNNNGTFGICAVAGSAATGNQNCSTGTVLCADGTYGGNSNGYATQELNSTNQGCLSTEHQSSWYYFTPTNAGTFSMVIAPNSGVDYDFAIWGPYTGLSCPVNTTPLRCSFASGTTTANESPSTTNYDTGLSATANGNGNAVGTSDGSSPDILDGWVTPITISAADVGRTYVILIDNFTANTTPFSIDITSSIGLNCTPLPIVLKSFSGENINDYNRIQWTTSVEINNDYFTLEHSTDGQNWRALTQINGAGTNLLGDSYSYIHNSIEHRLNYYKLRQTDFDGIITFFDIIAIDNTKYNKVVIKIYNTLGQEVSNEYQGLKIFHYSDGSIEKRF